MLRHVYRHDVTKVSDFYNGIYGEIYHFLSDPTEISFPGYIKNVDTHHEIQLEITSNKKVIAKKPFTNLYEMSSKGVIEAPTPAV